MINDERLFGDERVQTATGHLQLLDHLLYLIQSDSDQVGTCLELGVRV